MAYYRSLEIDITFLENHYSHFKTTLYAVVSIVTPSSVLSRSTVNLATCFKENLEWEPDRKLRFILEESAIQDNSATLTIRLRSKRTSMIDEAIGQVSGIPLKKLLDDSVPLEYFTDYFAGFGVFPVVKKDNKPSKGDLCFHYIFSEPFKEEGFAVSSEDEEEDED